MAVNLTKGQKVDLTKGNPSLSKIIVGLGWDTNKYDGGADFDIVDEKEAKIEEIKTIKDYSYFIVNDDLKTALEDARTIIRAEHLRVEDQAEDIIHKYESEGK